MKSHYKRDTDIMWFTQHGLCPHRNCKSFIIILSSKMKGQNLQKTRCILSSLSHILSHKITQISFKMLQYNTYPYYNAFLLQGNYHGKIPWVTQYHGLVNYWPTDIPNSFRCSFVPGPSQGMMSPRTPLLGQVYSKNGVQTQLNSNISEYGRSRSTTNILVVGYTTLATPTSWLATN